MNAMNELPPLSAGFCEHQSMKPFSGELSRKIRFNTPGNGQTMNPQTYSKKDLTKKDLLRFLEKIDSERIQQKLTEKDPLD